MLSTVEKLLFLKGIDLFQKLSNEDLVQIAQIAEEQHYERDEPMIVEGDIGDALFITVEGRVRISKDGQQLSELGGKEVLGEMGILDSAPRSASVTAVNDVTALKLEREAFHELMSERQEIAQGIIHVLLQRLRRLSEIKADEIFAAEKAHSASQEELTAVRVDALHDGADDAKGADEASAGTAGDAPATKDEVAMADESSTTEEESASVVDASGAEKTAVESASTETGDGQDAAQVTSGSLDGGSMSGAGKEAASDGKHGTDRDAASPNDGSDAVTTEGADDSHQKAG